MPHEVSIRDAIRDAANYCVREVLSGIDGGRARIKDVIDDINELFLEPNPLGWVTTNKQGPCRPRPSDRRPRTVSWGA